MAFRPLSRRAALKSIGVSIALPFLEAMLPRARAAQAAADSFPKRMVFVYFPNGALPAAWKTTGEGRDFKLEGTLAALEPLKSNLIVFSNLADAQARGGGAHACTL